MGLWCKTTDNFLCDMQHEAMVHYNESTDHLALLVKSNGTQSRTKIHGLYIIHTVGTFRACNTEKIKPGYNFVKVSIS